MSRNVLFWILAIVITLASAAYQRLTGPTHPFRGKVVVSGHTVSYKLPRAHIIGTPANIEIPVPSSLIAAALHYRRHNSDDVWSSAAMEYQAGVLVTTLPEQPSGGKIQYYIEINDMQTTQRIPSAAVILSRFRDAVPTAVLLPHVLFMFMAMLMSTRTGLQALPKNASLTRYTYWTIATIFVGGMIFGPLVQKYAFGVFWTGVPFGMDLTDNKTLIFLLVWLAAAVKVHQNRHARGWVLAAALITLFAFLIPHSTFGTELDYLKTGQP